LRCVNQNALHYLIRVPRRLCHARTQISAVEFSKEPIWFQFGLNSILPCECALQTIISLYPQC
jgi:hypothetical protein